MPIRSSKLTLVALSFAVLAVACGKKDPGDSPKGSASGSAAAATSAAPKAEPKAEPGVLGKLTQAMGGEITIARKKPVVGAKRKIEHTSNLTLDVSLGPKKIGVLEDEINKRTEEVLAVTGDLVTKAKVVYEQRTKTKNQDGRTGAPDKNVLAGKSFIVELKDGKLLVTNEEGKPVDAASKAAVEKDYKRFGKPNAVSAAVPTRALKVGEEVKELSAAIVDDIKEDMDAEKAGLTIDAPKVVLDRKEGDNAVFVITMTMRMAKGPLKGSIPITGGVTVRSTDGFLLRSETSGPINLDISEADKAKGVTGAGRVKRVDVYTPLLAAEPGHQAAWPACARQPRRARRSASISVVTPASNRNRGSALAGPGEHLDRVAISERRLKMRFRQRRAAQRGRGPGETVCVLLEPLGLAGQVLDDLRA